MSRSRDLLLALCVILAGCSSTGDAPEPQAGQASAQAHAIAFSGQVSNADGTPVASDSVTLKLTASGLNLFVKPDGSCKTDPHMQGGVTVSVTTDASGHYATQVNLTTLVSVANSSCVLQKTLGELQSLEVEASVDATQANCAAYCTATQPDTAASCQSACLNGNRRITANQTLAQAQVASADRSAAASVATQTLDFKFAELGPAISSRHGPDLAVDGAAAEASAHVTTETFAATDCAVVEGCLSGPGTHKLLRFDGTIRNLGDAPFVLGAPENNPLFKYSACHNHYHLQDIMLYELLDAATQQPVMLGGSAVVGRKQGFCMEDIEQIAGADSSGQYDCSYQGVSPGWADVYDSSLDCQWIDVTHVPAGKYILRITVNPVGRYYESDSSNNAADAQVTIN